ncbi:hypothetical protein GFS60_04478 [Rhodococcus sp. WAY2]|nr:hypothetical protein GFS60_04478 [Rhodococcus sp. WAY2]
MICAVSILVNFLWLPYYPMWAITIIALNAVVIWAVSAGRGGTVQNGQIAR